MTDLEQRVAKALVAATLDHGMNDHTIIASEDVPHIARAVITAVRAWDMEQASRFDDVMKGARNIP